MIDSSALRVVAVGSGRTGYQGRLEVTVMAGGHWTWTCTHEHVTTALARHCARLAVRQALDVAVGRSWPVGLYGKVEEAADGLAVVHLTLAESMALVDDTTLAVAQDRGAPDPLRDYHGGKPHPDVAPLVEAARAQQAQQHRMDGPRLRCVVDHETWPCAFAKAQAGEQA